MSSDEGRQPGSDSEPTLPDTGGAGPPATRPRPARSEPELAGSLVAGRYRLRRRLGSGGFGSVHLARDETLGRDVALKLLHASAHDGGRFAREARALARLQHPHVVAVHDFGRDGERDFLVLEHVDGPSLESLLAEGPLRWTEGLRLVAEVASALAHAADQGVLHRDVKPANVLLAEGRSAKVVDFGIARVADETALTATGQAIGTLPYMAPEMLDRGEHDERSEVWSLGVLLHEALVGRRPFEAEGNERLVSAILKDEPAPLVVRDGIPEGLGELIARCLRKDPSLRPPSAATLERELRALLPAPAAGGETEELVPARLRVSAAVAPPAGERRRVALLWIEERHLDELSERLSEAEAEAARAQLLRPVLAAVEERGGLIADVEHDGLLAVFGLPRVREADARLALQCAERVAALDDTVEQAGVRARFATAAESCAVESGADGAPRLRRSDRRALRELGAGQEPGSVAQGPALLAALRDRDAASGRRARDRASRAREQPLLGREAELALLREAARSAFTGRGLVVTLQGEAGSGKSRLLAELLAEQEAGAEGPVLLAARAPDAGQAAPGELARLLGEALAETPEARAALDDGEMERLTRPLGADTGLTADEREQALRAAWAKALRALAARGALLIAAEDVHDADAASLRLLERVAEWAPRLPLLLVATHRPGPSPAWTGRPFHRPVQLGPLPREAQRALLEAEAPGLAADEAARLRELADGNPFHLIELARNRRERTQPGSELPASVGAVLGERLDRLPRPQRELLQAGAILGHEFPLGLAGRIAGLDDTEVRERAEVLLRGDHLVESFAWLEEGFAFPHALLREAALESLAASSARELHGRAAERIEEEPEGVLEATPERLAHHWSRSSEPARALPHLDAAAERARAAGNLRDAVALARRAVELAAEAEAAATARERLAEVLAWSGAAEEAEGLSRRVLDEARAAGDRRHELRALRVLALTQGFAGRAAEQLETLEEALRLAADQGPPALLAELHARAGEALHSVGRSAEAEASLAALDGLAVDDVELRLDRHKLGALLAFRDARLTEARAQVEAGLELARSAGRRARVARFLSQRATVLLASGPAREAERAVVDCLSEARAVGLPATEAYALVAAAALAASRGRPAEAEAHADEALQVATDLGHDQRRMLAARTKAEALLEQDRLEEAEEALQLAAELAERLDSDAGRRTTLRLGALLDLARGRVDEAREQGARLLAAARETPTPAWLGEALLLCSRAAADAGALAPALEALTLAESSDDAEAQTAALLAAARGHRLAGDREAAAEAARRAADLAERREAEADGLAAQLGRALADDEGDGTILRSPLEECRARGLLRLAREAEHESRRSGP